MSTNILDPPDVPASPGWFRSTFEAMKVWKWNKKDFVVANISNQATDIKWYAFLMFEPTQNFAIGLANAFKVSVIAAAVAMKQFGLWLKVFFSTLYALYTMSS